MTNLETSLDHQTGSPNQQKMSSVPEPLLDLQQLRHPRDLKTKPEIQINPERTKLNKSSTMRTETHLEYCHVTGQVTEVCPFHNDRRSYLHSTRHWIATPPLQNSEESEEGHPWSIPSRIWYIHVYSVDLQKLKPDRIEQFLENRELQQTYNKTTTNAR